ncbi:MAG: BON domain-containing protein [bacterium]
MKIRALLCLGLIVAASVMLLNIVTLHASETDDRIESSARESYVFKTYLNGDSIEIQSQEGVVTLTGRVSEEFHKSMAAETMASLPGVTSVNNQLTVTGAPLDPNSDATLVERIRSALLLHRSVSNVGLDVSATDGKAILQGNASSEAQKELTTEYARDVSGVKEVDNQMTVTESPPVPERTLGEKIDDASVTALVRMSLFLHHGTDVFDTQVSTRKGVVTLSGTAKNRAEIDLATKLVSDIHGVESVTNQMTVEGSQSSTN